MKELEKMSISRMKERRGRVERKNVRTKVGKQNMKMKRNLEIECGKERWRETLW